MMSEEEYDLWERAKAIEKKELASKPLQELLQAARRANKNAHEELHGEAVTKYTDDMKKDPTPEILKNDLGTFAVGPVTTICSCDINQLMRNGCSCGGE